MIRKIRRFRFSTKSSEKIFTHIYSKNLWGSSESFSGPGSSLEVTSDLRKQLSELLIRREIRSILDCGCGDFNWMKEIGLGDIHYTGMEVVADLVARNNKLHASPAVSFVVGDISKDELPLTDLVICRDVLVHLTNKEISLALNNIASSGAKYLLATSFTGVENSDTFTGDWRPVNLQNSPYHLPSPIEIILEKGSGKKTSIEKQFCLWSNQQLVSAGFGKPS